MTVKKPISVPPAKPSDPGWEPWMRHLTKLKGEAHWRVVIFTNDSNVEFKGPITEEASQRLFEDLVRTARLYAKTRDFVPKVKP